MDNTINFRLTWDELRERARNHSDLSVDQKRDAVTAFDQLQTTFRNRLLSVKHPLFFFFSDRSSWRCEWAIWFARFLQSLKQHPDFPRLVRELGEPNLFSERMSVLKIAEILVPFGFSFSLDYPISIGTVTKKPDLFIKLNGDDPGFFIEVTTLSPHQKQLEADKVFREFSASVWPNHPQLECSGRLERILAPAHLQEILQKIQVTIHKALNETGFEALEIPGVVQIAFATKSGVASLETWAEARGMKANQLSGPAVNIEEFDRISFKLAKELEQVPADRANVIVIYSHLFTMPPTNTAAFERFVHSLEDVIYAHSHIGYLVLIFRWTGGNKNKVLRYGEHICVNRCQLYFNCDSLMLFKNRFAAKALPSNVEERFLKAFEQSGTM